MEFQWGLGNGTCISNCQLFPLRKAGNFFEITAQAYAQRFGARQPMTVLFRPARQPWLRELVAGSRQRPGLQTAPTTLAGVKQLIKALKAGQVVGLLPDQVPPDGQGVWAPFFGRDAYTMTLSARLAHAAQAQVLLAWGERLRWGRGFLVHVRPYDEAAWGPLSTDAATAARQINRAILNGWFAIGFGGSAALAAIAAVLHLGDPSLPWIIAALVLYVSTLVVTFSVNVPLNNALDASGGPAGSRDAAAVRAAFESRWVRWNTVRTLLSWNIFRK